MFASPWSDLNPTALLAHFGARPNVRYFPVIDPEETRRDKIDGILANRFELLGETHALEATPNWLANPSDDIEWHILLHKFYFAVGLGMAFQETGDRRYFDRWTELTDSWIAQTPVGFIAADVTGRRVQNWIYSYHYFVGQTPPAFMCPHFHQRLLHSLHEQVEFLIGNLHEARNHRTLELHAIFLASVVFPEFARAEVWREFALQELLRNMDSDMLPDGVHCELSTDYHHLVLRNYLNVRRLAQMNGIETPARMDRHLRKALEFALYVHRPDGKIPTLSDGDSHSYLELLRQGYELFGREDMLYVATHGTQGAAPQRRANGFPDAGYYLLRSGWGEHGEPFEDERYLVFDCGPLGEGNHGHFDLLSIEAYAYGRPLIVDPGRYTYHEAPADNWRVRFRGTAYHNTVLVDGKNQTRYEAGPKKYKVRGLPPAHTLKTFSHTAGFDLIHGIARSTEYEAVHERQIAFVFPDYWVICDTLRATQSHRYDLSFHLAPQAQGRVEAIAKLDSLQVYSPNLLLVLVDFNDTEFAVDQGYVSERYGQKDPAPILRFSRHGTTTYFHTIAYPHRDLPPRLSVRRLPVSKDHRPVPGACALAIEIDSLGQRHTDYLFCAPADDPGTWQFGAYDFSGSHVALRENSFGQVVRLHMSDGGRLFESGYPVTVQAE